MDLTGSHRLLVVATALGLLDAGALLKVSREPQRGNLDGLSLQPDAACCPSGAS